MTWDGGRFGEINGIAVSIFSFFLNTKPQVLERSAFSYAHNFTHGDERGKSPFATPNTISMASSHDLGVICASVVL